MWGTWQARMLVENAFSNPFVNCLKLKHLDLGHLEGWQGSKSCQINMPIKLITQSCPALVCLNLSGNRNLTGEGVQNIFENCSQLLTLNLSGTYIDDIGFKNIPRNCFKLQHLDLSKTRISFRCAKRIAKKFRALRYLQLASILSLGQEQVKIICDMFPHIEIFPCVA